MTFVVVPHGGDARSFEISYRRLRAAAITLAVVALTVLLMAGSFVYVFARAALVPGLRREIARLEGEQQRALQLEVMLYRLERQYQQVRKMLGADQAADTADGGLYLPAPADTVAVADTAGG